MRLPSVRRRLRAWLSRGRAAVDPNAWFDADAIDEVRAVYYRTGGAAGTDWDRYRAAHMRLPAWFRTGLDPWSAEYAAQQHRLWALMAGVDRPYAAPVDEQDIGWDDADPIRRPGYYQRRDPLAVANASDHWIATGMLMKHSGLAPGDTALEYGPGFGQTALALARLGVQVDTVDISSRFVRFMARQARHFDVPLRSFRGRFGDRPDPARQYRLIWFYESFHHCADFIDVVQRLSPLLAEGGRVILGGEPIVEREYEAVPYPWGLWLHSEVAAVVRTARWFELGFTESFLFELFARAGFEGRRIDCEPTLFGRLYVFERSTARPSAGATSGRT